MPSTVPTAPPGPGARFVRVGVGAFSRVATWVAVLCLLYATYLSWVTDLLAGWAQQQLRAEVPAASASLVTPHPGPHALASDPAGQGALVVQIPRLELDLVVLRGVDRDQLRRGPGLLPGTPAPGLPGNSVIAAHRVGWGAPFGRLDELRPGDHILAGTADDPATYTVMPPEGRAGTDGYRIVGPREMSVARQEPGLPRLTLVTCHPRWRGTHRLIVVAQRTDYAVDSPPGVTPVWDVADLSQLDFGTGSSPDWSALLPPAVTALLIWAITGTLSASPRPLPRWRHAIRWISWRTAGAAAATTPLLVAFSHLADLWPG